MHDTASQDDPLRCKDHDEISQSLRQVVGFQLPNLVIVLKLYSLLSPTLFDRGAAGHTFQTAVVAGAYALSRILRQLCHQHMTAFRMQCTVQHSALAVNADADAGTYCHIKHIVKSLGCAVGYLSQTGACHIGI